MRITLLQSSLHWQDPVANRAMFAQKLAPLAGQTDLVLLPEMFTTGFSMSASALAEDMQGETIQWMLQHAATLDAAIAGSFICKENGHYFNRLVFARPDGTLEKYDKRHLFGLAGEQEYFEPGQERLLTSWRGWRICPLVCYDLRFPVWSRNLADDPYDLLLYVANWPQRRVHHWDSLLMARAIENQAYVAGVNIVGKDGNGHEYVGNSAIIDFSGQVLHKISGQEGSVTAKLSLEDLQSYRNQLPFLVDADRYKLV